MNPPTKQRKPFTIPEWFVEKADPERANPDYCQFLYNKYLSKPAGEERREYLRSLSEQGTKRSRPDGVIIEDHPDPDVCVASNSPQLMPPLPPLILRPLTQKQQSIRLAIEMQLQMIALSYDADLMDMRAVYRAWLLSHTQPDSEEKNEMKDQ